MVNEDTINGSRVFATEYQDPNTFGILEVELNSLNCVESVTFIGVDELSDGYLISITITINTSDQIQQF